MAANKKVNYEDILGLLLQQREQADKDAPLGNQQFASAAAAIPRLSPDVLNFYYGTTGFAPKSRHLQLALGRNNSSAAAEVIDLDGQGEEQLSRPASAPQQASSWLAHGGPHQEQQLRVSEGQEVSSQSDRPAQHQGLPELSKGSVAMPPDTEGNVVLYDIDSDSDGDEQPVVNSMAGVIADLGKRELPDWAVRQSSNGTLKQQSGLDEQVSLGKRKLPDWHLKDSGKKAAKLEKPASSQREMLLAAAAKQAIARRRSKGPQIVEYPDQRGVSDHEQKEGVNGQIEVENRKSDSALKKTEPQSKERIEQVSAKLMASLQAKKQQEGSSEPKGVKGRPISQEELKRLDDKFQEARARRLMKTGMQAQANLNQPNLNQPSLGTSVPIYQHMPQLQYAGFQPASQLQQFMQAQGTLPAYIGGANGQEKRLLPSWAGREGVPRPVYQGWSSITTTRVETDTRESLRGVLEGLQAGLAISGVTEEADAPEGSLTVPLMKHQKLALAWMKASEGRVQPAGGVLADDQGLGKTISTIALILSAPPPPCKQAPPQDSSQLSTGLTEEDSQISEAHTVDLTDDVRESPSAVPAGRGRTAGNGWGLPAGTGPTAGSGSTGGKAGQQAPAGKAKRRRLAAGTLVVCPTSVLRQWANELRDKVSPTVGLRVLVYHGQRTKDPAELASYDVVLTTYSIMAQEVPKQPLEDELEKGEPGAPKLSKTKKKKKKKQEVDAELELPPGSGPLARVTWFRVVLDEAQSIKNCRTQTARAAWGLRAKRRWCLSGTPIQNTLDDLYSYLRFLRYHPFDTFKQFRKMIKEPIARDPKRGYSALQALLKSIMLRRTKATKIQGQPIVNLPERIVELKQAEFRSEERAFYQSLEAESRRKFKEFQAAGTVQKNYVNILWMLLRLRQACNHHSLVKDSSSGRAEAALSVASARCLSSQAQAQLLSAIECHSAACPICQDAPEEPAVTACSHVFCRQCLGEQVNTEDGTPYYCAVCKSPITKTEIYFPEALRAVLNTGLPPLEASLASESLGIAEPVQDTPSSSKIDAVLQILSGLPARQVAVDGTGRILASQSEGVAVVDTTEKAIVFSQWTSMLNLLEGALQRYGFSYQRLDGTMSVVHREKAIAEFTSKPEVTVMIMSLKAASLGLNLVAANHVLLLDVWWNPTTEDQAIDRAHRIGQTRNVRISRFTIKDTIEDRILALQEKKRKMVANAFGESDGSSKQTRLTMEDLQELFR